MKIDAGDGASLGQLPLTHPRVLVADDDEAMRKLVALRFRYEGYRVFEAANGGELVQALQLMSIARHAHDGVDLLVMDVRMPGGSGFDILRRLRLARYTTPAILMSAFADGEMMALADQCAVPLLVKPFSMCLLSVIARCLLRDAGST